MDKEASINASIAPAPPVFPPEQAGRLGILMLDTRFPRPPGDVGNPATWKPGTLMRVVAGVGPGDAVRTAAGLRAGPALPAFLAAARGMEADGVAAITTSCGFLALLQADLQTSVSVPVVTSSLLLLNGLLAQEAQVGVLTVSAERLGPEFLACAGVPAGRIGDVIVQGVAAESEFVQGILGNRAEMDMAQAGQDVVAAAVALKSRAPHLRTVVLECTNMPPYSEAIRAATGWRVLWLGDSTVLRGHLAL
ncbi:MAG TPA: aspartate/glutamate racemase family protein [Ramlibacter sp.]|nr:aspartate/glutamate racemase family protein [Ramlibacter sp.]